MRINETFSKDGRKEYFYYLFNTKLSFLSFQAMRHMENFEAEERNVPYIAHVWFLYVAYRVTR